VNAHGVVVGTSADAVFFADLLQIYQEAVLWTDGEPVPLEALVSGGEVNAALWNGVAINDAGAILAFGYDPTRPTFSSVSRGYLLEDGVLTDIGSLSGAYSGTTIAWAINDLGHVAGSSDDAAGRMRAFFWQDGVMTDLHATSGVAGVTSRAFDLNNHGQVCGTADLTDDGNQLETAVLWDDGALVVIGSLGGIESLAFGINDHGVVVGRSMPGGAFLWREGHLVALTPLVSPSGWILESAFDITNDGIIVGEGIHQGQLRPFLLVPELDAGYRLLPAGG
jgi:probable HAF family extracellular repeat protein